MIFELQAARSRKSLLGRICGHPQAQRGMPLLDQQKRLLQYGAVNGGKKAGGKGNKVYPAILVQPLQKPHALLAGGKRIYIPFRQQGDAGGNRGFLIFDGRNMRRQTAGSAEGQNITHGDFDGQLFGQLRQQTHGQQTVTTQQEEVFIRRSDRAVQHGGIAFHHHGLDIGSGSAFRSLRNRLNRYSMARKASGCLLRYGQGGTVTNAGFQNATGHFKGGRHTLQRGKQALLQGLNTFSAHAAGIIQEPEPQICSRND